MKKVLEVCVDSLISAREAIRGGADRLELCSALAVGGLTPYTALLEQIKRESDIPVRCLMRPRPGDFLYTREELELMAVQIRELRNCGADGFVLGCLTPEGELDGEALAPLLEAASGTGLTLHRAMDVSRNLEETYVRVGALGFDTVLTSGGGSGCLKGLDTIGRLLTRQREQGGPEILIGAGVNAQVIGTIRAHYPEARCFHMSGKREIESGMSFRREGVPMGLPGLDEWHIRQTDGEAVRQARAALYGSAQRD